MKLYISADIEGVACIAAPTEADISTQSEYLPFREQMTAEVAAACDGAFEAGAGSVLIKDAHGTARNLDQRKLVPPPDRTLRLIRGWSGHPFKMVQDIDRSFDAAAFVGFHAGAGSGGNPLAHTVSGRMFNYLELNGEPASEFRLYGLACATVGVPVVFLSGDRAVCEEAERRIDGVVTVATAQGQGASVQSMLPAEAVRRIREGVARALWQTPPSPMAMPKNFHFVIRFVRSSDAYARSFFPGAKLRSDSEVVMETDHYLDVLTFLTFAAR